MKRVWFDDDGRPRRQQDPQWWRLLCAVASELLFYLRVAVATVIVIRVAQLMGVL